MMTPEGPREVTIYETGEELAAAMNGGEIKVGDRVVFKGRMVEVAGECDGRVIIQWL